MARWSTTQRRTTILAEYSDVAGRVSDQSSEGGLISYETDPIDLYRRVATYVDGILKGGTIWCISCNRFDPSVVLKKVTPATLPPGRLRNLHAPYSGA
jgi:hypothetical protein